VALKGPPEEVEKPPPVELVDRVTFRPVVGAGVLSSTVTAAEASPAVRFSLVGLKLSQPEGGGAICRPDDLRRHAGAPKNQPTAFAVAVVCGHTGLPAPHHS
jgi:hypothetical protein